MRTWALVFLWLLVATSVPAQGRPPGYAEAERSFEQAPVDERLRTQLLLSAAGFWPAVPNEQFNGRIYKAISDFQSAIGAIPDGILSDEQYGKLKSAGLDRFAEWGFREIRHPTRGIPLWVPMGLDLQTERTALGYSFQDYRRRILVSFDHYRDAQLKPSFETLLATMVGNGSTIIFKVIRPDFFVVSSTRNGIDGYLRYQRDGTGLTGFTLNWNNSNGNVNAERIATVMSGSLWSAMTSARFPDIRAFQVTRPPPAPPPAPSAPPLAASLPPVATAPAVQPPSPATPPVSSPEPKEDGESSGTGFFISSDGLIVTNNHVVKDCRSIEITADKFRSSSAIVLARDATNDLALLKSTFRDVRPVTLRAGAKLGEAVAVFGFPLTGVLAASGNFTLGNVTALVGFGGDSRGLQISAPVQPGNSGGPLLDKQGNVIGVVTSKLNALRALMATGDIPQNVNFAIKASVAATFLESSGTTVPPAATTDALNPEDLAGLAKTVSVFIACR